MPANGTKVTVTRQSDGIAVFEVHDGEIFRKVTFGQVGSVEVIGKMPWEMARHPVGEFLRSMFKVRDGFKRATMSRLLRGGPWPLDERGVEELRQTKPDPRLGTQLGLAPEEYGFVSNLVRESILAIHHCALSMGMEPRHGVIVADAIPALVQVLSEMFREESDDYD